MKGLVTSIESREVKTKFGVKPVYDLYVDGSKFSWGFKDPTKLMVTVGSEIEFDFTSDKYGNKITEATVKVLKAGSGGAATPAAPKATTGGGGSRYDRVFPVPATSGEIAILRQNALTNARELVSNFPNNFGVDITGKVAGDQIIKTVLEVARSFADYTSGRDLERTVEALTDKMEE